MSALFGRFPGFDPTTGMVSMPLWAVGAAAALFVVLCLLAFSRAGREGVVGGLARVALVFIGASGAFFFLDGNAHRDLAAERRALDMRALELLTRAVLPGSALACLDASAGETVEASCEKALFVTPETTAAAVSFVSAQLALLADFSRHAGRTHAGDPPALINLRRATEGDRFGLVAQVIAVRDGCTPSDCRTLALFHDASRVSANLSERAYDFYVARHAANWPAIAKPPVASLTSPAGTTATAGRAPGGNVFFPSSASIPPVNIMNSEPPLQESSGAGTAAAKQPPTPPRRPAQQPAAQARPPVDLNVGRSGPPPTATQ